MANKDLLRKPHNISNSAWWYEEPPGMVIVCTPSQNTTEILIRWSSIRAALKRKDMPEKRR